MSEIQFEYDELTGTAVAVMAGRPVKFRGSRSMAEQFFADLERRTDVRGVLHGAVMPGDISKRTTLRLKR